MGSVSRYPLLIGSFATHYWFSEFRKRDIDCYATPSVWLSIRNNSNFDIQLAVKSNGLVNICNIQDLDKIELYGVKFKIADPEMLLLIKRIHLEFVDKWIKNVKDYIFLWKKGIKPRASYINIFKERLIYLRKYRTKLNKNRSVDLYNSEIELSDAVENREVDPIAAALKLMNKESVSLLSMKC